MMGFLFRVVKVWLERNVELKEGVCYNKCIGCCVKVCIFMYIFGYFVKIDELVDICCEWYIELVEDVVESIGSFYKGCYIGIFGKVGVISFNGNKIIIIGGGGMLFFQDEELGVYVKYFIIQVKIFYCWEFCYDYIGYNYWMLNINVVLGCVQLENLDCYVVDKCEIVVCYVEFFKGKEDIIFFIEFVDCKLNYWFNVVVLKDKVV